MTGQRQTWSSKTQQYAALVAISMNLRTLLWCPLLVLRYGLGTFAVGYMIVTTFICYPLLYVESLVSQFTKSGNRGIFNCCPLFRGISYSMAYFAVMANLPQYSVVSHAIIYLLRWLENSAPWTTCEQATWAAENGSCYSPSTAYTPCDTVATVLARRFSDHGVQDGYPLLYRDRVTIVPIDEFNNASANCMPGAESAVVSFYNNVILGLGRGVSDLWGLRPNTLLLSATLFTALFGLVSEGLPKMRHALYVLAAAKCTLLLVLFCGTIFREGAFQGIGQLPTWKLELFAHLPMWQDVVAFAVFGIGLGGYGISFIGAHNSFQNNFVKDIVFVLVVDTVTCLGTASVIFFVFGSYGYKTGLEIDQIMGSNVVEDLAFIQVPQALLSTETTGALLLAFLLFVAVTGFGPLLLTTELVAEVVDEEFPHSHVNKRTVRAVTSVLCCCASCVYATPAGPYIEFLILEYLYSIVGFANIVGELLVVFQLYGLERVMIDCGLMLEKTPGRVLQVLWSSVIPMVLTILLLVGLLFRPSPTFRDYEYSVAARITLEAVVFVGLTFVPSYAYSVLAANDFKLEVVKAHATRWRPADPQFAREYKNRLVSRGLIVHQHRQEAIKYTSGATVGPTGTFVVHTGSRATGEENPAILGASAQAN